MKVPYLFVNSAGLPSQLRFEQKWLPGKAWERIVCRFIRGEGSIAISDGFGVVVRRLGASKIKVSQEVRLCKNNLQAMEVKYSQFGNETCLGNAITFQTN